VSLTSLHVGIAIPKIPKGPGVHIRPVGNGFHVQHGESMHFFGSVKPMIAHLKTVLPKLPKPHTVHTPWLGNKTMTPRLPGAARQRRAKEVSDTSYQKVRL